MTLFAPADLVALACFIGAWCVYAILVEWTARGREKFPRDARFR